MRITNVFFTNLSRVLYSEPTWWVIFILVSTPVTPLKAITPHPPVPRGHLVMLGDIFDCGDPEQGRGGATDIYWVEARDAAK